MREGSFLCSFVRSELSMPAGERKKTQIELTASNTEKRKGEEEKCGAPGALKWEHKERERRVSERPADSRTNNLSQERREPWRDGARACRLHLLALRTDRRKLPASILLLLLLLALLNLGSSSRLEEEERRKANLDTRSANGRNHGPTSFLSSSFSHARSVPIRISRFFLGVHRVAAI